MDIKNVIEIDSTGCGCIFNYDWGFNHSQGYANSKVNAKKKTNYINNNIVDFM